MTGDESEVLVDMLLSANTGMVTTPLGGRLVRLDSTTNEYDEVVERVETFGPVEPFVLEEMEAREFQVKRHPFVYAIKYAQQQDYYTYQHKFIVWAYSVEDAEQAWQALVEDGESELWPDWINHDGYHWDGTESAGDYATYLTVYDDTALEDGQEPEDYEGMTVVVHTGFTKAVETEEAADVWFGDWGGYTSIGMLVLDEDGEQIEDEAEDNPAATKARLLRY